MANQPPFQPLADRRAWAAAQLRDCRLCPRQCRVNRSAGETGWCGAGAAVRYFLEFVHYGEEPELVPSHTLYLSGCNLQCRFCHTAGERAAHPAVPLTSSVLAGLIARGRGEGARNLNILGGEPGVNLPGVLELLAAVEPRLGMATGSDDGPWSAATGSACLPPLIWNSNFYCAPEVLEAVSGLVALYLPDLKFGCSFCAEALCGAADYWEVVTARLREVSQREPGRMLVRHLLLPGHFSCCTRPALAWLAREIPGVRVSLKRDYLVMPQARSDARLRRFLTPEEVDLAAGLATSLGLNYQLSGTTPCDLAAATACPHAAGNGQPAGSRPPQTLEIAISPQGQVFLRHPTRAAAAAVARACGGEATKEA